jgi:CRISPR-associated endonuclease/helicase Cas3
MAHLWAKSPRDGAPEGYSLLQHTLDVCWQAAEFYRVCTPQWTAAGSVCLPRVLAYASLMHDFGKVHRDFQAALRPPNPRFENRHEVLSLAFLAHLRVAESERPWLAAAIASHHKGLHQLFGSEGNFRVVPESESPHSHTSRLATGVDPEEMEIVRDLLRCAPLVFRDCGWPEFEPYELAEPPVVTLAQILRSEASSITDFLRQFSLTRSKKPGPPPIRDWSQVIGAIHTRGILINADHLASFGTACLSNGLTDLDGMKRTLESRFDTLNSFQATAASRDGHAILCAPTGSGKTEAALLWAVAQAQFGRRQGRTYFLLPYQASMNAMQKRLIEDLFPLRVDDRSRWNYDVSLAHGRSARKLYEALLDHNYEGFEATALAKARDQLARLNVAPITVSSPFALIRLILASRGAEALWQAACNSRIVIDEIHAYQPQITAMLLAAIRFLVDHMNASVLFMTATLPEHLRMAISSCLPGTAMIAAGEDVMNQRARHRLRLQELDALSDQAFHQILEASRETSVLVVLNQVARASELYTRLRDAGADTVLLHSRFNHADRARIENEISPYRGRILVATQAVEVSLNVSFGTCFSELAPLESLQQRFGRCNRRGELGEGAPVTVFCCLTSHRPYDKDHLAAVLTVLQNRAGENGTLLLTESLMRELLDTSYPPAMKAALEIGIRQSFNDVTRYIVNEFVPYGPRNHQHQSDLEKQWEDLFDGEEVLPDTMIEKARLEKTWLGRTRYLVPIPGYMMRAVGAEWNDELLCFVAAANYSDQTGLEVRRK